MENELNYLSEKIEELSQERDDFAHDEDEADNKADRQYAKEMLKIRIDEVEMLNSILSYITRKELNP